VDRELRTLLQDKADEVRLHGRIPEDVLRRSRRRRVVTGALAGLTAAAIAAGIVVAGRAALTRSVGTPPEVAPGGLGQSGATFYPLIYPETQEVLEATQAEVAQGSMPMWTAPDGVARLYAVNVLGWDPEDVAVSVRGDEPITAVISNPALSQAAGAPSDLRTTLTMVRVPGGPRVFAVLAAQAEALEIEPVGPDRRLSEGGALAFRGRAAFVPEGGRVVLTLREDDGREVEGSTGLDPDGRFEVGEQFDPPPRIGPNTVITLSLRDSSGRTLAHTSARLDSPVAAETEAGASGPVPVEAGQGEALPQPVAATRSALLDAAAARDWGALRALIPRNGFTFSFGGERDPIAYWRKLESVDHVPVLGDILPVVLSTEPGRFRGAYIWPAQAAQDPTEWDEQDLDVLRQIHNEENIRLFQEIGLYTGWRVEIAADGTWLSFVAGD
jgi:hypothetical protein